MNFIDKNCSTFGVKSSKTTGAASIRGEVLSHYSMEPAELALLRHPRFGMNNAPQLLRNLQMPQATEPVGDNRVEKQRCKAYTFLIWEVTTIFRE